MPTIIRFFRHPASQLLSLILLSIGLYAQTFDVPFYLDDHSSLSENPVIYLQQGALAIWHYSPLRFLPYLSFSGNYALHQFTPAGYHLVSIVFHALCGLALWWLLRVLLRTPRLQAEAELAVWLPWFSALLFIAHPLQTQAVTYIVQRPTLFAALFYLLAIGTYVQGRLATRVMPRVGWFALTLGCALAGFFSKQNAATLPAALLLVELLLFQASWRRLGLGVGLMGGSVLMLWCLAALSFGFNPLALETLHALTRETESLPRSEYFLTQMGVLWQYLGLLVWPLDLHIDRDVAPASWGALSALLGHVLVIGLALWLARRWPLVSFGLLFYYLAHLIESSFLPIRDLMFEHRSYLPNVGMFVLVAWGGIRLFSAAPVVNRLGANARYLGLLFGVLVLATLATLTWQRNQMWRDPVGLWWHNAQLTPHKDRPWGILGKHLLIQQRPNEALQVLQYAINLRQQQNRPVNALDLINLVVALRQLERDDEALVIIDQVLSSTLPPMLRSKMLVNKGNIFYVRRELETARDLYRQALQQDANSLEARANLGNVFLALGDLDQAEHMYREVLNIVPNNPQYQANYAIIREALQHPRQP